MYPNSAVHPRLPRRTALQVGACGLLGLGMNHVAGLRALATETNGEVPRRHKSVIYIFLSGGLAQQDSFDPKPNAPDTIRGEFAPIATQTSGIQICEHLPKLAACSDKWAIVRSLTHPYNEHSIGHHVMLTGRTPTPVGFNASRPTANDSPSIASIVNRVASPRNNLPPAAILPEKLIHVTGRTIPGQFAGEMGESFDPWLIEASQYRDTNYTHGAFPEYGFQRQRGRTTPENYRYEAPRLELAQGVLRDQFEARRSLLMARQLVEAGVSLIQVNLGNDESWDTHEAAFGVLRDFLLPPTDRAVSALIEDLSDRGLLDDVLIVMAGEFGRTPKVFTFPGAETKLPRRDHWGAVPTVFFAGGGVRGGTVVGESDAIGGYPKSDPQTPENMAATIYEALGLPRTLVWKDKLDRPHQVYHGDPIPGLT